MRFFAIIGCLLLASCSASQWNERLSTPADREIGLKVISALRSGQLNSVRDVFEPTLFAQTAAIENKTKGILPANGAPALVTVNSSSVSNGGKVQTTTALNYEIGLGQRWAFVQVLVSSDAAGAKVIGWHATPTNRQPSAIGNFELAGKSATHTLWLLAMAFSTATIIAALVFLWKAKGIRRRWLWVVGSLAGIGQFTLNWANGAWGVSPISFLLLGSSAIRPSPFDPWMLSFSIPVVAIVFLIRRPNLLAKMREGTE